ncbi:QRFP-like peptide receptor [Ylistrum balloti]|uniref:QRFP-like peptide receptor n=1 Tax=Ylistrum balloti TaxID=509963 RepID=UPI00290581A1|nr:QRFP-like peptide receptor [Ylistrum balloti]
MSSLENISDTGVTTVHLDANQQYYFTNSLKNDSMSFIEEDRSTSGTSRVFILLYTMTTLTSIFGNIAAIIIFAKGKRSKSELRPFLINLAVADLIMAIFCIPFTFTDQLLSKWIFSKPMCPIVLFLQTVSVTASASTNMAVGIDRFYAVAYPLKSRITSSRYRLIILLIWIIAVGINSVQFMVGRAREKIKSISTSNETIVKCAEVWEDQESKRAYSFCMLFLTYIIPLIILTVTYSIVGCILWQRRSPGNADVIRDEQQIKSKRKIVKMLVTIVTFFGLCWLPLHLFILVLDFNPGMEEDSRILPTLTILFSLAHWIAMSNSFVNPIIYGFMNNNYRADLRSLIFTICPYVRGGKRIRQGAVKWKSRGHVRDDSFDYEKNSHIIQGLLRSNTDYRNGKTSKTMVIKTSSTKSF